MDTNTKVKTKAEANSKVETSLESRIVKFGDSFVPYEVVNVADCLKPPRVFNFPDPVGEGYTVKKFHEGFSWDCHYLPIYGGFDIETTNIIEPDEKDKKGKIIRRGKKRAYMYHAQMSVFSRKKGVVFIARTWPEVVALFKAMIEYYGLNTTNRIVSWIANASFEFQFLRHWIDLSDEPYDFFAKERRQPLLFTMHGGIEFRECLSISGGSLAQLAKDYTWTQKKKDPITGASDLDYSIPRNSKTVLSDIEREYCISDVTILCEWGYYIAEEYMTEGTIPMTKTGLIRSEVKKAAKAMLKGRMTDWKKLLIEAQPDYEEYKTWREFVFRGGYVKSKKKLTGIKIKNVTAYDITSSYPSRMNLSRMPSKFVKMPEHYYQEFFLDDIAEDPEYCFIVLCTFKNLRSTLGHSIESSSKCLYLIDPKIDNGRIEKCGECKVWLTSYDWLNYRMFYEWDECIIETAEWSKTMWLPPYLLDTLNRYYKKKSELKMAGLSDTVEYAIYKSGVNSMFGMCCTEVPDESWGYLNDEWAPVKNPHSFDEEIGKSCLLQSWGIFIAAAARHELLRMVYRLETEVGKDYPDGICIYSDTDSIKIISDPRADKIIEEYNADIARQLKERGLTDPAFHDLGMFDKESGKEGVRFFKTLGAKRYMCDVWDKKKNCWVTKITIAGLPKLAIKNMGEDPYKFFSAEGMKLEPEESLKRTHAWNDEPTEDWVEGELMSEKSSVAIYDIPFTLKLDEEYYTDIAQYLLRRIES